MSNERTSQRPAGGPRKKRPFQRRKVCRFCADKQIVIDYKDPRTLRYFVSERGKIIPRRISGNCSKHQREITEAIKRARNIALLPIAGTHVMP
jgi:small subunit ribosomal protein S18